MKFIKSMLLLCLILISSLVLGFLLFISKINNLPSNLPKTQAIVVLTGGSERIRESISLLKSDYAQILFVSGADRGVRPEDLLADSEIPKSEWKELSKKIIIGTRAIDTFGNAEEAEDWINENNIKSLILVTSNYHMPRSLIEFKRIPKDVNIIPYPVISPNVSISNWWEVKNSRDFLINEYLKYLGAIVRGWLRNTAGDINKSN